MTLSEIAIIPVREVEKDVKKKRLMKIFSDNELRYCFRFKNSSVHLAGKLAAKKASIKILRKIIGQNYAPRDIEIINLRSGKPVIVLGKKEQNKNPEISLSISHTKDIAVALCTANANV
ncbi:MAG: 4'-phosphopantetheinyl transferase superfamily protein [Candidatus Omnitrophica bacterium]|nr:4'-phosphopantetheinyl transferase superfamily protein [Candidatus Omnitrophota bacterium]